MRIAIIGAGISGLTVAHLLHTLHDVTVFEADSRVGGHANTIAYDSPEGTYHLDTGFMVFNDRNYPNFERLIRRLGVRSQPSSMSFSVSDGGAFEYASGSLDAVFANRGHIVNMRFQRMLAEVPRFQRAARQLLEAADTGISLRDWLSQQSFSEQFIERLIVPQVSAVWSADPRQLWRFPALFLARFFDNHGMLSLRGRPRWSTIEGGSCRYVQSLSGGFRERIFMRAPVDAVTRREHGVHVRVVGAEPVQFDHVVISVHADQALRMLTDASPIERELLGAIPYQRNEAVLHTDTGMLPRRRRAWASWNYHLQESSGARATVTYHLNRLQSLQAREQFCVTLNLGERIDPERIIRRVDYAHPVYTAAGAAAQERVSEISGVGRTHFCGAYWGWGFHEDGVTSALRVAEALGGGL